MFLIMYRIYNLENDKLTLMDEIKRLEESKLHQDEVITIYYYFFNVIINFENFLMFLKKYLLFLLL